MTAFPSFLKPNNIPLYIPLYIYTPVFFAHLLIYIWVASTSLLMRKMALWTRCTNISPRLCCQFFLGLYPEMGFLDHIVVLFFFDFWGPPILFSMVIISLYLSVRSVQGFQLFHILYNTCLLFIVGSLLGVSWYLTVVLICIPWWLMMLGVFFMYLLQLLNILFEEMSMQVLCPFKIWLFDFFVVELLEFSLYSGC